MFEISLFPELPFVLFPVCFGLVWFDRLICLRAYLCFVYVFCVYFIVCFVLSIVRCSLVLVAIVVAVAVAVADM